MDTNTEQNRLTPKEMAKEIWNPVVFAPPAERTTSPLGPIVLADMEDAGEQWEAIVARVSHKQAAQLEADRAYHTNRVSDEAWGAAFAVLGTDTVEKIRVAVYNRVAASDMERRLQAELLERFGAPLENFLADVWAAIDLESGCGLVFPRRFQPFFEAAYKAAMETLEQDIAAEDLDRRQRRAAEPTTE